MQVVLFLVNYIGEIDIIHHFSLIMMMMAGLMMIETTRCCCNVFANKCTKSECIIIAASLHQKTQ